MVLNISGGSLDRSSILKALGTNRLPVVSPKIRTFPGSKPLSGDVAKMLDIPALTKKPAEDSSGLATKALKVLDLTRTIPSSFFKETFDLFQGEGWSGRDFWKQASSHYGFGDLIRDERDATATFLALTSPFNMGIGLGLAAAVKADNIWADRIIGGIGDLSVDVLTYMGGVPAILRTLGRTGTIKYLGKYVNRLDDLADMATKGGKEVLDAFKTLGIKDVKHIDELKDAAQTAMVQAEKKRSLSGAIRSLNTTDAGKQVARHVSMESGLRLRLPGTAGMGRFLRQDQWINSTIQRTNQILGRGANKGLHTRLADAVSPWQKQMFTKNQLEESIKLFLDSRRFGATGKAAKAAKVTLRETDPKLFEVAGMAARAPVEFVIPALTKRAAQTAFLANATARLADLPIRAADRLTPQRVQKKLGGLFVQNYDVLKVLRESNDPDRVLLAARIQPKMRRAFGVESALKAEVGKLDNLLNQASVLMKKSSVEEMNRVIPDLLDATETIFEGIARTSDGVLEIGAGNVDGIAAVAAARAASQATGNVSPSGMFFKNLPDALKNLSDEDLYTLMFKADEWLSTIDNQMLNAYGVKNAADELVWAERQALRDSEGVGFSGPRAVKEENRNIVFSTADPSKTVEPLSGAPGFSGRRAPGSTRLRQYQPDESVSFRGKDVLNPEDLKDPRYIATRIENGVEQHFLQTPVRRNGVVVGFKDFKPAMPKKVGMSVRRQIDQAFEEAYGRSLYETDFTNQWTKWSAGMGPDVRVQTLLKDLERDKEFALIRNSDELLSDLMGAIGDADVAGKRLAQNEKTISRLTSLDVKTRKSIAKRIAAAHYWRSRVVANKAKKAGLKKEVEAAVDEIAKLDQTLLAVTQEIDGYESYLLREFENVKTVTGKPVTLEDIRKIGNDKTRLGRLAANLEAKESERTNLVTSLVEIAAQLDSLKELRVLLKTNRDDWERYVRLEVGQEMGPIVKVIEARKLELEAAEVALADANKVVDDAIVANNNALVELDRLDIAEPLVQARAEEMQRLSQGEVAQFVDEGVAARTQASERLSFQESSLQDQIVNSRAAQARSENLVKVYENAIEDVTQAFENFKGMQGGANPARSLKEKLERLRKNQKAAAQEVDAAQDAAIAAETVPSSITPAAKEAQLTLEKAMAKLRALNELPASQELEKYSDFLKRLDEAKQAKVEAEEVLKNKKLRLAEAEESLENFQTKPKGPLVQISGMDQLGVDRGFVKGFDDRLFAIDSTGTQGVVRVRVQKNLGNQTDLEPFPYRDPTFGSSAGSFQPGVEQTVNMRSLNQLPKKTLLKLVRELKISNRLSVYKTGPKKGKPLPLSEKVSKAELLSLIYRHFKGSAEFKYAGNLELGPKLPTGSQKPARQPASGTVRRVKDDLVRDTGGTGGNIYRDPSTIREVENLPSLRQPPIEENRYVVVRKTGRTGNGRPVWELATLEEGLVNVPALRTQLMQDIVGGGPGSTNRQNWRNAGFRFYDEGVEELSEVLATPAKEAARAAAETKVLARKAKLRSLDKKIKAAELNEALVLSRQRAAQRGQLTRETRALSEAERALKEVEWEAMGPEGRARELKAEQVVFERELEEIRAAKEQLNLDLIETQNLIDAELPEGPYNILDALDDFRDDFLDLDQEFLSSMDDLLDLMSRMKTQISGLDENHFSVKALKRIYEVLYPKGAGGLAYRTTGLPRNATRGSSWVAPENTPFAGASKLRGATEEQIKRWEATIANPNSTKQQISNASRNIEKAELAFLERNPELAGTPSGPYFETITNPVDRMDAWLRVAREYQEADRVIRHEEFILGGRGQNPNSVRAGVRASLAELDELIEKLSVGEGLKDFGSVGTQERGIGSGNPKVVDLFTESFGKQTTTETFNKYEDLLENATRVRNDLQLKNAQLEKLRNDLDLVGEAIGKDRVSQQRVHRSLRVLELELMAAQSESDKLLRGADETFAASLEKSDRLQGALDIAARADTDLGRTLREADPFGEVPRQPNLDRLDWDPFAKANRFFHLDKEQRKVAVEIFKDSISKVEWGPWRLLSGDETLNDDMMAVINAFARINDPAEFGADGAFWKQWDKVQTWLKAGMIATPGFVNRNVFGAFFNAAIDGVNLAEIFKSAKMTTSIAKKADDQGKSFLWAAGEMAKSKGGDYKIYYELLEAGVRGGGQAISSVELELGLRNARNMRLLIGGKDGKKVTSISYKPWSPQFAPFQAVRSANSWVEDVIRLGIGMDTMKWGGSIEDSLVRIAKTQFDYDELTKFERKVAKRILPFYTWTRKNLPYQLEQLGRHPARYNNIMTAKRNLELGTQQEGVVPDYYLDPFGMRLPFKFRGAQVYMAPDLPFQDLFRYGGEDGWKGALKQLVSGSSPIVKTPLETYFNKSVFTDVPFTGRYQQLPEPLSSLRWLMPILSSQGWAKKAPNGEWKMRDHHIYFVNGLVPTFGVIRRLFPNEEKYQRSHIRNLLSTLGGLSVNFNTPEAQMNWSRSQKYQRLDATQDRKDLAMRRR